MGDLEKEANVPVYFVRPGGIICAHKGPLPGWIHETCFYAQLAYYIYKGQLPFFIADKDNDINMAPVDYVSNLTMACVRESLEKREDGACDAHVVNGSKICIKGMTFDQILETTTNRYQDAIDLLPEENKATAIKTPPKHPWYIKSQRVFDVLYTLLVWIPLWFYTLIYGGSKKCNTFTKIANLIYKYVTVLKPYLVRPVRIENGQIDELIQKYPEYEFDGSAVDKDEFSFLFIGGIARYMVPAIDRKTK